MRTSVYVDGFNLYYGCLKSTRYKWLDLARLCSQALRGYSINRIRYFTALVSARPGDPQQPQRQQTYIRALETLSGLSVHYGHFLSSNKRMVLAKPAANGPRTAEVVATEEKGSDVNLATYLILDAVDMDCELAVIISNDSDLKLPIELVRQRLGLKVGILNPQQNRSWALSSVVDFYRPIREGLLAASQFPDPLMHNGVTIRKPATW